MLTSLLQQRALPQLLPRHEMLDILQREVYGYLPPKPDALSFRAEEGTIPNFCAGKASLFHVEAHCTVGKKDCSFPFHCALPTDGEKHPFFVLLNFRDDIPDRYIPVEELIDNGFAVIFGYYKDVTGDDENWSSGIAAALCANTPRQGTDPGKIAMWAWALQRMMDYAQTLEDHLDLGCGIVCGHSRLGKTALLAAATDSRFAFAYSNDSGCTGAALSRGKQGETVRDICTRFPYWFCENYKQYMDREEELPLDQHFLAAAIAPRHVLIGSGSEDLWADPASEYLCCVAAGPAFPGGFRCEDRLPEVGEEFLEGHIGYHLRKGPHYFSRTDWLKLIKFVNLHRSCLGE